MSDKSADDASSGQFPVVPAARLPEKPQPEKTDAADGSRADASTGAKTPDTETTATKTHSTRTTGAETQNSKPTERSWGTALLAGIDAASYRNADTQPTATRVNPDTDEDPDFSELVADSRPERDDQPGSRLDRWWAKVQAKPRNRKLWYWGGPIGVTILGGILRFWDLGSPRAFMFDETYYVKDAITLSRLGYEASWPSDANTSILNGNYTVFDALNPEFVVHPPLGKWIFSLTINLFGPDNPVGWRFMSALMGTLAIFILAMLARRLFHSTLLATIAGGLLAIDGLALTLSRMALLDQPLMFFILLATYALVRDREWYKRRLLDKVLRWQAAKGTDEQPFMGPAIWWRPWLLACAIFLGAATSVKWSGLYFIAFYGIYVVVADMLLRRRYGMTAWYSAAVLKQGPVTAILLLVPSFAVYLASWTGWLITDGGWGRNWADQPGNAATGFFSWVPTVFQSLWHYHVTAYNAALAITSPHSWAANPLTWPLMTRPTLVYREMAFAGDQGCDASSCIATVSTIANPIIWWSAQLAVVALIIMFIRKRDWRIAFILLPIAAGYLPWLLYLNRTVFQIYTVAWLPYLILALVYCIKVILGENTDPSRIRTPAVAIVGGFLTLVVAVSIFFYPLWVGTMIPYDYWALHSWLPWTWQ